MKVYLIFILLVTASSFSSVAQSPRQNSNQASERVYEAKEVDNKARITHKPDPQFTEQARRNRTSGWVVLRVVLKSSGEVGEIRVIRDLTDGLTEECIKVAREIKFEPAMKDGNPVSQYVKVEYLFMSLD